MNHELRNRLAVIANAVYYLKLVVTDHREATEYFVLLDRELREVRRLLGSPVYQTDPGAASRSTSPPSARAR